VIPDRLSIRIGLAFAAVGLVIVVVLGAGLLVVLRDLHREATQAALADVARPVLASIRPATGAREVQAALDQVGTELPDTIGVYLFGPRGRVLTGNRDGDLDITAIELDSALRRGEVTGGMLEGGDGRAHVYAAAILRTSDQAAGPVALVVTSLDRSGGQALADLGRVLPGLVLIVGLVGGAIAWLLARSVTRPLASLADATANVPLEGAAALPERGPREVRELTAQFNAMTAEIQATRSQERDLLASVRHDLRTPVTVIAGFAQALRDGTATGPAAERAARAIEEEAARMARLVEEIGVLEQLGSGPASLRPEPIDPAELIAATVQRFEPQAQAVGVALAGSAHPPAAPASEPGLSFVGDRVALERILGNLVENAIVHAGASGGRVLVEGLAATLHDGKQAVALRVSDDGPGFPAGSLARVFDRFYRGDPARAGRGSGLGLAIVRALAEAHGGTVVAENLAPSGGRVTVTLPVVPPPQA
jgi:signal transduction histidine kinase